MTARFAVLMLALIACGRMNFDEQRAAVEDATVMPDAACTTFGAWGAPVALTDLSSISDDWGAWISPDKLEIMFASGRAPVFGLYRSRRASLADTFQTVTPVDLGLTTYTDDPFVTDDGLTLYFDQGTGIALDLYVATRPSTAVEFTVVRELTELNTATYFDNGASLTSDQLTLYFNSTRPGVGGTDLYVATRASVTDPFGAPSLINDLSGANDENSITPYAADTMMVFASDRTSPGVDHIMQSTRTATGFSTPVLLSSTLMSMTGDEVDPAISRDGTTIVFSSNRPGGLGQHDLYMAERPCQ